MPKNDDNIKIFGELAATMLFMVANEAIKGTRNAICKFSDNYEKRRDTGYTVFKSISGAFDETGRYFNDTLHGRTPVESVRGFEITK